MPLASRVRDYEVWGRLGEGGMSEVWLAKHTLLCVPVVMKTVRAAIDIDPEGAAKRVFNEARLMARVTSPRIVRAVDAGVEESGGEKTAYLVEEYVDGIDLAELDHRRRRALGVGLPLWFVSHAMHEICDALSAAHQVGVIHRDVKPSNAFASPGTGVRLGDFGIAVAQHEAKHGEISGTVRFMAPEQLRGEPIDRRTDVYGAGATAYDLRYGDAPFTDSRTILDLTSRPTFRPPQHTAEAYFQHLLSEMLAKDPDQRPRDAAECARHFAALVRALKPMRARLPVVPVSATSIRLGEVTVTFEAGDIARVVADCIVSSANDQMTMRSGTGDALRARGGDEIEREAIAGGKQPLGACVATTAGKLDARHVIHAVSAWNEASCIGRTTARALLLAEELGHRTIALPALGTGAARVSIETCACAMMAAIAWHIAIGGTRLREIHIVLGDEAKLRAFREVADSVLRDGEDLPAVVDLGLAVDGGDVKVDAATMVDARSRSRSR